MNQLDNSLTAMDAELDSLKAKVNKLSLQNKLAMAVLEDIFKSECFVSCDLNKDEEKYDHYNRPAFAEAQNLLIQNRLIEEEQCLRPSPIQNS